MDPEKPQRGPLSHARDKSRFGIRPRKRGSCWLRSERQCIVPGKRRMSNSESLIILRAVFLVVRPTKRALLAPRPYESLAPIGLLGLGNRPQLMQDTSIRPSRLQLLHQRWDVYHDASFRFPRKDSQLGRPKRLQFIVGLSLLEGRPFYELDGSVGVSVACFPSRTQES